MAGDWIKMRGNLWDDPRVSKLCDLTDQSEAAIVGALYWLWAAADQHTEDGLMPGLTLRQIDRKTGVQGFGAALCQIGWLEDNPDGVRIVNFEDHNGTSAKRRCTDAQRKANVRNVSASDADKQRTESGQKTPNLGAREEKRREEEKTEEAPSAKSPAGSALPKNWILPAQWAAWAQGERPDLDPNRVADEFRDYWIAKPGKEGRKADWEATWRNWVRNQRASTYGRPAHSAAPRERGLVL